MASAGRGYLDRCQRVPAQGALVGRQTSQQIAADRPRRSMVAPGQKAPIKLLSRYCGRFDRRPGQTHRAFGQRIKQVDHLRIAKPVATHTPAFYTHMNAEGSRARQAAHTPASSGSRDPPASRRRQALIRPGDLRWLDGKAMRSHTD